MSNYPRDEFDNIPESSSRQGVHRTAMAPPPAGLWPILSFAAAALLIGLAAFLAIPRPTGGESHASATATKPSASSSASPSLKRKPAPSPTDKPSLTPTPRTPTPSTPPKPVVDRTQPVAVYNASGVTGLAARVASKLRAQGWSVPQVSNWHGAAQSGSSVLYESPGLKANAEEIAAALGIPSVTQSPESGSPVTVILGPGAR